MKQIGLTKGKFAIVDDSDFDFLNGFKWCAAKGGLTYYAVRGENKRTILMHRSIMNPAGIKSVDHKNGCGLDNRRENLRICSRSENMWNRGKNKKGSSKFKGVYWHSRYGKWYAKTKIKGVSFYIGSFSDEKCAAIAYDKFAIENFGEFARTNF